MQLAQDGFTPLHAAASVGNMHAVEALLELPREFADPFAVDLQVPSVLVRQAARRAHTCVGLCG
jgi:ankyrin repeat protein